MSVAGLLNNSINSKSFKEVLLESKPVEQFFTKDPLGEMLFGKITKKKAWGRTNLVPVKMSDSYELQFFSESYPNFQSNGVTRIDKLANITPVSQTARLRFSEFMMTRLLNGTAQDYIISKQEIIEDFQKQIANVMIRQLLGKKDGRVCYIGGGGTSATQYLYGWDGNLLPQNHILWSNISTKGLANVGGKLWDIKLASDGTTILGTNGQSIATVTPSTGTVIMTDSNAYGTGTTTYVLCPYSPGSSGSATAYSQFDGIQDWISSAAAYLTDEAGSNLTSATDANWSTIVKAFSGNVLDEEVMEYLLANCWGDQSGIVSVLDPMVLSKTVKDMASRKFIVNGEPGELGYIKTYYVNGDTTVQLMTSKWYRGSGWCDLVNPNYLGYMGTVLEPRFARPEFQLLEDTAEWINDLVMHGQFYTKFRHAHTRGTGLAKSSY